MSQNNPENGRAGASVRDSEQYVPYANFHSFLEALKVRQCSGGKPVDIAIDFVGEHSLISSNIAGHDLTGALNVPATRADSPGFREFISTLASSYMYVRPPQRPEQATKRR